MRYVASYLIPHTSYLFILNLISHFLVGFGLSFVGSLPFGMINLEVARTAVRKGIPPALWVAAGASLVEMLQVYVALKFTSLFAENPAVEKWFQIISIVVFFGLGIYYFFFAKIKPVPTGELEPPGRRRHKLMKGMFLSTINLMAIPYWIFYGTLLTAHNMLDKQDLYIIVFSVGTAVGVFVLLILYSMLGAKILRKSAQVTAWLNVFIGLVLVAFGVFQLWDMMNGGS